MATQIVEIGGQKFVCGLFWQSLSRPRELKREAIELGRRIESDLMVLRYDQAVAQAGYAQTRDGARRGMFSLGAVVSKTLAIEGAVYEGHQQPVHNWLSAFKLPNGMWAYFAVRDANFLPNGDFVGTKEEVLDRLHGDYGLGGWNVVIGDKELEDHGFHNFSVKQIQDLIPHKKNGQIRPHKWWALRPVERKVPWKLITAIGALIIVASAAGFAYWQQHQKELEEARQRERAIEAARQKMLGQAVPSDLPHPWSKQPLPQDIAQACMDKLRFTSPGGWLLDEYVCNTNQVTYSWSRGQSTVGYLLAEVPQANVQTSGDKASYSENLNLKTGRDEELLKLNDLIHPLLTQMQLLDLSLKIGSPAPLPTTSKSLPGLGPKPIPQPDWQTLPFTLSANSLPPTEIAPLLAQPGIRLEKISYRAGAWSIDGVIYAK
ncbi:MAG TPA: type 4b pilus protein PilO2 [Noviherbaspirillum sp.]|nr:type 4b pilus protein PilO2 [Noviherbaspirillum sp.]